MRFVAQNCEDGEEWAQKIKGWRYIITRHLQRPFLPGDAFLPGFNSKFTFTTPIFLFRCLQLKTTGSKFEFLSGLFVLRFEKTAEFYCPLVHPFKLMTRPSSLQSGISDGSRASSWTAKIKERIQNLVRSRAASEFTEDQAFEPVSKHANPCWVMFSCGDSRSAQIFSLLRKV
nr:TMV resistance protein N-like isoform X1 [Ipomoea batatas]